MLVDLPSLVDYSMAGIACDDLFVSELDDDYIGDSMGKCGGMGGAFASSASMALSDPDTFMYTSSSASESDFEMYDDDDITTCGPFAEQTSLRSVVLLGDPQEDREIMLHSPGTLLGTPRDSSRRYEYQLPAHMQPHFADPAPRNGLVLSTISTPALSPPLAGTPSPPTSSVSSLEVSPSSSSVNISMNYHVATTSVAPTPVPIPVPIASSIPTSSIHSVVLQHVSRPLSAPAATSMAMHPKLLHFNPADVPVPPRLRGRMSKSGALTCPT